MFIVLSVRASVDTKAYLEVLVSGQLNKTALIHQINEIFFQYSCPHQIELYWHILLNARLVKTLCLSNISSDNSNAPQKTWTL